MLFYLTLRDGQHLGASPFPELDGQGISGAQEYLSPGLPLAYLVRLMAEIEARKPNKEKILKLCAREFPRLNSHWEWKPLPSLTDLTGTPGLAASTGIAASAELIELATLTGIAASTELTELAALTGSIELRKRFRESVAGRQLTEADLSLLAPKLSVSTWEIFYLAQVTIQTGIAVWLPAVAKKGRGWHCNRCGGEDAEEWPSCYGIAATCRSCSSLGASTSLQVLYRTLHGLNAEKTEVCFRPHWALTPAQEAASLQLMRFVQSADQREALVWAACGAGKTEVCFPAANWALAQGKTVLFAAPRQDVIHDVVPRLQRDFPELAMQILTGESRDKFQPGSLVLATTHQNLRFSGAFDFIFLDEMDAFPYEGNQALARGIHQALKATGKIIYLTATPSQEVLRKAERKECLMIRLPARHHRQPLPVPACEKAPREISLANAGTLIELLRPRLESMVTKGCTIIFVPKVTWVGPWVKILTEYFPDWRIEGSFSADPGRRQKITELSRGTYNIFVSTSILERGVTITGAQVMVLAADNPIFDERSLVQMAGRAGRVKEYPGGDVLFLAEKFTPSIRTAIGWIKEQNHLAASQGLLD